jgi:hypothetical protein
MTDKPFVWPDQTSSCVRGAATTHLTVRAYPRETLTLLRLLSDTGKRFGRSPIPAPCSGSNVMPNETRVDKRIRKDVRAIREAAGLSQEAIGDLFGWQKAAVSKVEKGYYRIRLSDYLRIVDFCRDAIPDHPALALADYYAPRKRGDRVNPYLALDDSDTE